MVIYADKVVAITDCLVPFPNFPAHISMTKVDYVVVVDAIGDPKKIATGAAKPTTDMRKLMMADYCTQFVVNSTIFQGWILLSDRCRRCFYRIYYFTCKDHEREKYPHAFWCRRSDKANV